MDRVPRALPQLTADTFEHPDDVADISIRILHPHIDDAPVIGNAVKLGVHLDAPLSKLLPDIPRKNDMGTAFLRDLMDHCVVLIFLSHLPFPLSSPTISSIIFTVIWYSIQS